MKFALSAILPVAVLAASAIATPILTEDKRSVFPGDTVIDDASSDLTYSTGWTHLTNQGFKLNGKTESYTGVNGWVQSAYIRLLSWLKYICHGFQRSPLQQPSRVWRKVRRQCFYLDHLEHQEEGQGRLQCLLRAQAVRRYQPASGNTTEMAIPHSSIGSGNQYSSTNGETDTQVVAKFTG